MEEMEVGELGAVSLANGSADALTCNVDTDADFVRMGLGVGGEKMAMAAANLPSKGGRSQKTGVGGGLVRWDVIRGGGGSKCDGRKQHRGLAFTELAAAGFHYC